MTIQKPLTLNNGSLHSVATLIGTPVQSNATVQPQTLPFLQSL